ncbi:hypothetical protein M405DRAFT_840692 [Rhizopogon salebrosus TDB-379]|nr:hypothetical protein M405DRAFT_840692 [Rhizopogon salebrosus TDB-379]
MAYLSLTQQLRDELNTAIIKTCEVAVKAIRDRSMPHDIPEEHILCAIVFQTIETANTLLQREQVNIILDVDRANFLFLIYSFWCMDDFSWRQSSVIPVDASNSYRGSGRVPLPAMHELEVMLTNSVRQVSSYSSSDGENAGYFGRVQRETNEHYPLINRQNRSFTPPITTMFPEPSISKHNTITTVSQIPELHQCLRNKQLEVGSVTMCNLENNNHK